MEHDQSDIIQTIQFTEAGITHVIPVDDKGKPLVGSPPASDEYGPDGKTVHPEQSATGNIVDTKA